MIKGYKSFYKGLINQFGSQFEIGKIYETNDIVYEKSGFYFCPYLEDTLRYYDGLNNEIDIALVVGFGYIRTFYDEYNETESIASTKLKILKVLSRDEIINYALSLNELQVLKFIRGYLLTEEEINKFRIKFQNKIDDSIDYYQKNKKNVFRKK